jgi:hypothetical protein
LLAIVSVAATDSVQNTVKTARSGEKHIFGAKKWLNVFVINRFFNFIVCHLEQTERMVQVLAVITRLCHVDKANGALLGTLERTD